MKPVRKNPDENSPDQHTGSSQDQILEKDVATTDQKLGDNQASAVPTSGSHQHNPENKNRSR